MCTVTYFPLDKGFILTSSRDEKVIRHTIPPESYRLDNQELIYPKDTLADGTWIAVSNQKRVACLLNGAFDYHIRSGQYRISRGQLLLENFKYRDVEDFCNNADLTGIEPFTLLILTYSNEIDFTELRWDGKTIYYKKVNINTPAIWSSATLYNRNVSVQRERWFANWIGRNKENKETDLVGFHISRHSDDVENDIVMERTNGIRTLSVSQISIRERLGHFRYIDLLKEEERMINLIFPFGDNI